MAKLYFRYGAMNSGKSTSLLQAAYNYEERGQHVLLAKPAIDTKGAERISSRLGVARDATSYEIKRAFLELRRAFEPSRLLSAQTVDLHDDVTLILEVVEEAFDILRDDRRRDRYRRAIEAGPPV